MSSNMRRTIEDDEAYEYPQSRANAYDDYDTEYGESKQQQQQQQQQQLSSANNDRYSMYKAQVEADQARIIEDTRKPFVRNIDKEEYGGFHIGANLDKGEAQRKKDMERELYRLQLETDAYTKPLNDEDATTANRKPYVRNNTDEDKNYGNGFTIGSTMDKNDMKRQKAAEQELYRLQLENDIYAKKPPLDSGRARSRPRGGGGHEEDYDHPLSGGRGNNGHSSSSSGGLHFGGQSDQRGSARDKQGAKDDYRRQLDMDRARKHQDYGGEDNYSSGSGANNSRGGGGGGYNSGRMSAQQVYGGYTCDGGSAPSQADEFHIGRKIDAGAAKSKRQADQELYRQQLLLDQEEQKLLRSPSSRNSARNKSAGRRRVAENGELGGGGGMQIGGDEEALRLEKRRLALEMLALNQQQSRDAQGSSSGGSYSPSRANKARNNSAKGYHAEKASQIRSFEDAPGMIIGDRESRGYGGQPAPRAPPAQQQGGFMDLGANERDTKDQKRRDALQDYMLNQQAAENKRNRAKEEQNQDMGYSSSYSNVGYADSNSRHGSGHNSGYNSARSSGHDLSPRKQSNATGYTAAKAEEMRKFEESSGGFQIGSDAANGSGGGAHNKRAQQAKYAMMLEAQQAQNSQYSRAGLDSGGPASGRGAHSGRAGNSNRDYEDSIDGMMRDRPYSGSGGHGTGFNIGGDASAESDSRHAKQREYKRLLDKQKIEDEQMQRYEELKRRGGVF